MRRERLLAGCGLVALVLLTPGVAGAVPVTLTVYRVRALVTEADSGLEALGEDTADLYASGSINGVPFGNFDTHVDDAPVLDPTSNWRWSIDVPAGTATVPIVLSILDHDDTSADDLADIDPGSGSTLELTVDMATGRWSGETSVSCVQGSGDHGVFLCFDISTLSTSGDADGDGLLDGWEANGYDGDGGALDVDLPALGAHPLRRDVFVELDCLVAADHSHCLGLAALADVAQAFANAPVANPDGTTGVQLHVDVGPQAGAGVMLPFTGTGGVVGHVGDLGGGGTQIAEAGNTIIDFDGATGNPGTSFYTLKAASFDARRAPLFRYALSGHQTNSRRAVNDCTSGTAEGIPGNDFYVTLGGVRPNGNLCWGQDANGFSVGTREEQAGTFMHELGHTLGLPHGGADGVNDKPNYLSVMNYSFQSCTVTASVPGGLPGGCDFSRVALPTLTETDLDECAGLGGGLGFGANDWDGDAVLEGVLACNPPNTTNVVADINDDAACTDDGADDTRQSMPGGDDVTSGDEVLDGQDRICNTSASGDDVQRRAVLSVQPATLTSFDDWSNLAYGFRALPTYAEGASSPVPDEPDPDTLRRSRLQLSTRTAPAPTLQHDAPATVLPGQTVQYTVTVRNAGRGPALQAALTATRPDATQASFPLGTVVLGAVVQRSVSFGVPQDACPQTLTHAARLDYLDMASFPGSVSGGASTQVLDVTPPELALAVTPARLAPPNHKLHDVTVTVEVSDSCDPTPTVTLLSVVSSEADEGLGDGDTAGDVQGAAVGTDDRAFVLRAERAGGGPGRTYTATYEARDASGNTTTRQVTVSVPR